jgi:hypothetical protein
MQRTRLEGERLREILEKTAEERIPHREPEVGERENAGRQTLPEAGPASPCLLPVEPQQIDA